MSFQERRSLVNFVSTILIMSVYTANRIQFHPQGNPYSPEVFHFWGSFFLILVPVSIVARIVIYIIFYILNTIATQEEEPDITDERDRLIDLKATRNSMYVFALGFLVAMVSLVMNTPPPAMFAILLGAGITAEMVGDLSQFLFYRRGV